MKYIVWDFISPYDGYDEHSCDSWDEVLKYMQEITRNRNNEVRRQYNMWVKGQVDQIKCGNKCIETLIFVTSGHINKELVESE